MPPKLACPLVTPGASKATASTLRSTGNRVSCSRVRLVADSVEVTSKTLLTLLEVTVTAARLVAAREPTFTVVVLPSVTTAPGCVRPTTAPSLLAACAGGAASHARHRPMATFNAVLRKTRLLLPIPVSPPPGQWSWCVDETRCRPGRSASTWLLRRDCPFRRKQLPCKVVGPLVVVEVAALPFDFAALVVDVVGAEVGLGRHQRLCVSAVEGDPIRIQAAQVEPLQRSVAGLRMPAGMQLPERHVHRQPAVRGQIELAPVVDVVVAVVGEDRAGLPACRNAVPAQQRDQQQRLLPAVAVDGVESIVADVGKGRVLVRAGPGKLVDRGEQLLDRKS